MSIHVLPGTPVRFPAAWSWFFDETVPSWVKSHYSPRESWKDKPFTREDAKFFFRGVEELSDLFTEERHGARGRLDYFSHPKYRSAYLLYFLPLQAAKFVTVFQLHAKALRAALEHGRKQGVLRVLDLGAGPGTASFALILELLQAANAGEELPKIELHWVDTNLTAMQDGKKLLEQLCNQFSRLRGKVEIELLRAPWWKGTQGLKHPLSLVLMGHVLNESSGPKLPREFEPEHDDGDGEELRPDHAQWAAPWQEILSRAEGGGTLIVEPAAKINSQFLSRLRDTLLGSGLVSQETGSIWGPCPHVQKCPLSGGRDWCHFSVPAHVPGTWFAEISKGLGSERQWLKFSYLWLSSQAEGSARAEATPKNVRLVVSDVLFGSGTQDGASSRENSALTCEPEKPGRIPVPKISKNNSAIKRGDWVKIIESTIVKKRR